MTHSFEKWLLVIPARLESQRLPKKPILDLGGKPLIVRVVENLSPLARAGARILVATDAPDVQRVCQQHAVEAELTSPDARSGTDRIHEVAARHDHELILNVQGDEPFVATKDLESLMQVMEGDPYAEIGTLVHETHDPQKAADPNIVKAVGTQGGSALYFSRAPVPYRRGHTPPLPQRFWQHIGIYAFRKKSLETFCGLPSSSLEQTEKLEQLRALEAGMNIRLVQAHHATAGIDTPEDLEAARARY